MKKEHAGREVRHLWDDMFTTSTILGFTTLIGVAAWTAWVYLFGF